MKPEQKIVAIGAASGVLFMALSVWLLTAWLPVPTGPETAADRIVFALRINVVALLPFFVMLIAIDPTRKAENETQLIDGRVADNTLQQNFVFAVASLALSTVLDAHYLQALWACAIVYVVARLAFRFGYRKHPLLRAPGMILYVLYSIALRA
jgi:hypothetical protein